MLMKATARLGWIFPVASIHGARGGDVGVLTRLEVRFATK